MVDTRFPTWKEAIPNKSIQAVWFPWCSIFGRPNWCVHVHTSIHIHTYTYTYCIYIYVFCSTHRSWNIYLYISNIIHISIYFKRGHISCHMSQVISPYVTSQISHVTNQISHANFFTIRAQGLRSTYSNQLALQCETQFSFDRTGKFHTRDSGIESVIF